MNILYIYDRVDEACDDRPERDINYCTLSTPTKLHDQQYQEDGRAQALESLLFISHMYSGPDCYIKPKGKSNLKIIRNAICSVCLAGEVNTPLKLKTLAVRTQIEHHYYAHRSF